MWTLSGFADEIDPDFETQCAHVAGLGLTAIELRSAWGVNSLLSFLRTWLLDHTHSPNKVIAKVMVDESIERRNHEALVKQTADYVNSSKSEV